MKPEDLSKIRIEVAMLDLKWCLVEAERCNRNAAREDWGWSCDWNEGIKLSREEYKAIKEHLETLIYEDEEAQG